MALSRPWVNGEGYSGDSVERLIKAWFGIEMRRDEGCSRMRKRKGSTIYQSAANSGKGSRDSQVDHYGLLDPFQLFSRWSESATAENNGILDQARVEAGRTRVVHKFYVLLDVYRAVERRQPF